MMRFRFVKYERTTQSFKLIKLFRFVRPTSESSVPYRSLLRVTIGAPVGLHTSAHAEQFQLSYDDPAQHCGLDASDGSNHSRIEGSRVDQSNPWIRSWGNAVTSTWRWHFGRNSLCPLREL